MIDDRPILIDFYSCAGGAGMGYSRAGFRVFSVDLHPQPHNPFPFHQGNALDAMRKLAGGEEILFRDRAGVGYLLGREQVAAAHSSPPCQQFTAYRRRGSGVGDSYLNLIPETRDGLRALGVPYVIENVPGAPLEDAFRLCGSSFALDVRRHRFFEHSFPVELPPPCDHTWQTPRFPPATNRANPRSTVEVGVYRIPLAVQRAAMGIDWMTLRELSEAIPPVYTEWVGQQLLGAVA